MASDCIIESKSLTCFILYLWGIYKVKLLVQYKKSLKVKDIKSTKVKAVKLEIHTALKICVISPLLWVVLCQKVALIFIVDVVIF